MAVVASLSSLTSFTLICIVLSSARGQADLISNWRSPSTRSISTLMILNLFLSDTLQSIGFQLNYNWLLTDSVQLGGICNTQGFMINFGDVAAALWSLIIAIHTYCILAVQRHIEVQRCLMPVLMLGVWGSAFVVSILGPTVLGSADKPFYTLSGAWCWISPDYAQYRMGFHYGIMLFCATALLVIYAVLIVTLRKRISFSQNQMTDVTSYHPSMQIHSGAIRQPSIRPLTIGSPVQLALPQRGPSLYLYRRRQTRTPTHPVDAAAKKMLFYPIAYIIVIFPLAFCRIAADAGIHISFPVTVACGTVFACAGLVNGLVYSLTRKLVKLNLSRRNRRAPRGNESFVSDDANTDYTRSPVSIRPNPFRLYTYDVQDRYAYGANLSLPKERHERPLTPSDIFRGHVQDAVDLVEALNLSSPQDEPELYERAIAETPPRALLTPALSDAMSYSQDSSIEHMRPMSTASDSRLTWTRGHEMKRSKSAGHEALRSPSTYSADSDRRGFWSSWTSRGHQSQSSQSSETTIHVAQETTVEVSNPSIFPKWV